MKRIAIILLLTYSPLLFTYAQDVVPKAKTKAEKKAERKNMTLEQKIESTLPVDVNLPTAKGSVKVGDQEINSIADAKKFLNETLPSVSENAKKKSKKAKKEIAKAKAAIFDGKSYEKIAIEKKIWKRGSGARLEYKEFYLLKNHQKPNPYLRSYTWFDKKTNKIVEALTRDTRTNVLLHGPYKEYRGENLMAEGYYFLGAKDGRWLTYDKDFNLLDKVYYKRGFLQEAEISYFADSVKIKEILPKQYGKVAGNYYRFFEDGTLAEEGKYDEGKKIGKWIEYYPGNRRKKETLFTNDPFVETQPVVLTEFDDKGKIIYQAPAAKN